MTWFFLEIKESAVVSPSLQPNFLPQPPPIPQSVKDGFNLNNKVSPSVLLIIIILAIIFFISGLLHLLVRFVLRPANRDLEDSDNVTALQGQLQQLFHLHDAGVDQSFIDTLPVFHYKAIIGLKNPFDCAVCLSEFEPEEKLRLLPKCSHAFHMECIDTWLLSHSTCPLCRGSLLPEFTSSTCCSPMVLVLESGSEISRESIVDRDHLGRTNSVLRTSSHLGYRGSSEFCSSHIDYPHKSCEILANEDVFTAPVVVLGSGEKVVPVKLGKYRTVDGGESSCNNHIDARRCFSMGSFEYVMDENSLLQVPIRTPVKKQASRKPSLPLTPSHRLAMSDCDCESTREFTGFDTIKDIESSLGPTISTSKGNVVDRSKKDSFSVSKIWLQGKEKQNMLEDSSRRAFSFRFPVSRTAPVVPHEGDSKLKNGNGVTRRTISETGISSWENAGSKLGCDEENQSRGSSDLQTKTPSFARRTLHWISGRQNKVVHSSSTPNI